MPQPHPKDDPIEIDTPWFDLEWLLDHPDFPLAATVASGFKEGVLS